MVTVKGSYGPGRVEEFSLDTAADLLSRDDISLWFALDSPTPPELEFLESKLKIHHLTLEDIVKQNQRPKAESFEDYLYVAIHALVRKDHLDVEPAEVDLLLGHHWLVMVRYGPIPGLTDNPQAGERLDLALTRGVDFLLYAIVDLIVDSYFPLLDEIDQEIDALEDRLLEMPGREDMDRMLTLKRSLVHVRRAVGPQREVFNQLTHRGFRLIRSKNSVYFRDVYDHLIRITEEVDSLRDLLAGALEIHLSSTSNQLNKIMKRLTAWGIILVAIAAIAGVYGMNFEYMPELRWRYGYPAIMGLMAAISIGLYFYFKKRDYF